LMAGGSQVGNAVPVQMARVLLEPIVNAWKPTAEIAQ
jgi:site-specific DNA-cytosine methylase